LEIADQLANEDLDTYFKGLESFFGYNNIKCKWIIRGKTADFETLPKNAVSRRFLNYSSKRKTITGILSLLGTTASITICACTG
jgi:hypothetical protein